MTDDLEASHAIETAITQDSTFKRDIVIGLEAEGELVKVLKPPTSIEVKWDLLATRTGNLFVETESFGQPSGLSTTEAEWWAFVIGVKKTIIFLIRTERLRYLVQTYGTAVEGGEQSKGYLLPISRLQDAGMQY